MVTLFRRIVGKIIRLVHGVLRRIEFCRYMRQWHNYFIREQRLFYERFIVQNNRMPVNLSLKAKQDIASLWRGVVDLVPDDSFYCIAKAMWNEEPNPKYVPDDLWFTNILPYVNPLSDALALEDKSKYGFYFSGYARPRELVRRIRGGGYYNENNELISFADAVKVVMDYARPIIVKPTVNSQQGQNVRKLSEYSEEDIVAVLTEWGGDVSVQECVEQFAEMSALNASSLNSYRITSLFLNGQFSVLSTIIRVGGKGAVVDNVGAGGYAFGLDSSGVVKSPGLAASGRLVHETYSGDALLGKRFSGYASVVAFVEKLHRKLPYLPIIGWDIAVRKDGCPVLIELNASTPGIRFEQLCTGPLFGNRFDEVVDYVRKQRLNRSCSDFCSWRPDSRFSDYRVLLV